MDVNHAGLGVNVFNDHAFAMASVSVVIVLPVVAVIGKCATAKSCADKDGGKRHFVHDVLLNGCLSLDVLDFTRLCGEML